MFITKEELDRRLSSINNLDNILNSSAKKEQAEKDIDRVLEGVVINRTEKKIMSVQGRTKGDENIPTIFRDIIAVQANIGGDKGKDLAKAWGVSESRISDIKQGIPNRANPEAKSNIEVQDVIAKVTGRIRDKICDRIEMALDSITPDKLLDESAKTLSAITSNLARTAQGLESKKEDKGIDNRVQTIIYAPQTADIKQYAEINVAR